MCFSAHILPSTARAISPVLCTVLLFKGIFLATALADLVPIPSLGVWFFSIQQRVGKSCNGHRTDHHLIWIPLKTFANVTVSKRLKYRKIKINKRINDPYLPYRHEFLTNGCVLSLLLALPSEVSPSMLVGPYGLLGQEPGSAVCKADA